MSAILKNTGNEDSHFLHLKMFSQRMGKYTLVQCFLCKPENLSLGPQSPHEKPEVVVHIHKPIAIQVEVGESQRLSG